MCDFSFVLSVEATSRPASTLKAQLLASALKPQWLVKAPRMSTNVLLPAPPNIATHHQPPCTRSSMSRLIQTRVRRHQPLAPITPSHLQTERLTALYSSNDAQSAYTATCRELLLQLSTDPGDLEV